MLDCTASIITDMALDVIASHIILEAIPYSIGVGIAKGLLQQDDSDDKIRKRVKLIHPPDDNTSVDKPVWQNTLADAGATALGATVVAFSIAPTDEVPMVASALTPLWLLALVAASSCGSCSQVRLSPHASPLSAAQHALKVNSFIYQ